MGGYIGVGDQKGELWCWLLVIGRGRSNCFIGGLLTRLEKIRRTFKGVETVRIMALVVLVN